MKYIYNCNTNCYYNLALEEYAHTHFTEDDYILLWQNENTVVVGRHQNTAKEINSVAVKNLGIRVVRRNSGGGAVFHDNGNLNFSFITDWDQTYDSGYRRFLEPVIQVLSSIGVSANLSGRNDLLVEGKKVSGNAQHLKRGRILHHGTLLVNSDLDRIQSVLRVPDDKLVTKGISSVRSRVANIQDFCRHKIVVSELADKILNVVFQPGPIQKRILTAEEQKDIIQLQERKYQTWEWNYGRSPEANFHNRKKYPSGTIEISLFIDGGTIQQCIIQGDFLSLNEVTAIEQALIGVRYKAADVIQILSTFDLELYFPGISVEEILDCFF